MAWRLAGALERLRREVNSKWPRRSTASDGTLGDTSHAARKSDHNPALYPGAGPTPVVRAFDVTNEGIDHVWLRERIRQLGLAGDRRLNPNGYVISDRRIASAQHRPPWQWHPYDGSNPHDKHTHVSVGTDAAGFDDDVSSWLGGSSPLPSPDPDDGEDDMFSDADRELLRRVESKLDGVSRGVLVDIAEGRDDVTNEGTLAKRVASIHAGDFGERPGHVKGSLGWLDRRLARLRRLIVADVKRALGQEVEDDPTDVEDETPGG